MSTRLTWLERMAMGVEQRFPIGHDAWKIIYLIAMVALLPSVLILSLGTGVVAFAHLTRGLYSTGGASAGAVASWNLLCVFMGWFFCSWLVMAWRLFRCHRLGVAYTSPCLLWVSGLVLLAEQALLVLMLAVTGINYYWSLLAAALMLLIWQLHQRHCHKKP